MSRLVREFMEASSIDFKDIDAIKWLEKKEVKSIKYDALYEEVVKVRKGLAEEFAEAGLDKSQISIIGMTSVQWMESYLGIITGNNAAVPLDSAMPLEELFDLIDRSDSVALFLGNSFEENVYQFFEACPKLKKIWFIDGEPESIHDERVKSLDSLKKLGNDSDLDTSPDRDDLAMIIFTSGTSGKSKGVMLTQHNLAENVQALMFNSGSGIPLLNVLPVHHAFCLVMDWLRGFANGAVICINDSFMHMIRNMSIFKPKSMLMVPLMIETFYKRLKNADPSMSKEELGKKVFGGELKLIFSGGAHLETFYIEKFREYGVTIMEGYGMSECSPVISANTHNAYKPGSVGKPLSNVELKFEDGEILVRGSSVMKQYYKMPDETSQAFDNGWLHTGDKGYLDEDGFLFITGRIKNLIILSNGENVSPEEIENKLALNELVGEIIITGEENGLVARVYPDQDVVTAQGLEEDEIKNSLQVMIDAYNSSQPSYRYINGLVIRKNPFNKTATRKIKRQEVLIDE